jgi:PleD family two-component response regulator
MVNQERERNDEARRMSNNAVSVLIIDDDRPTPRLLKRGLAASKYRPVEAGTGKDGLDLLSSKRPDIGSSSDQPAKGWVAERTWRDLG